MKNVIVYTIDTTLGPTRRWKSAIGLVAAKNYIDFQIENSLRLGWSPEDVCIVTNFNHSSFGIQTINLNKYFEDYKGSCLAKYAGAAHVLREFQCPIFLRDHDCFQIRRFDGSAVIGDYNFVCCQSSKVHLTRISDQSCFMSPNLLPTIEQFLVLANDGHKHKGVGFRFGKFVSQRDDVNLIQNPLFPYRFNMVDSDWKKTLSTMIEHPYVFHEKLAKQNVVDFLTTYDHLQLLELYTKYSLRHMNIDGKNEYK